MWIPQTFIQGKKAYLRGDTPFFVQVVCGARWFVLRCQIAARYPRIPPRRNSASSRVLLAKALKKNVNQYPKVSRGLPEA